MAFKLEYTVKGSVTIPEDVYKEYAQEGDLVWEDMSDKEKADAVKECEEECSFEGLTDDIMSNGRIEITSVTEV